MFLENLKFANQKRLLAKAHNLTIIYIIEYYSLIIKELNQQSVASYATHLLEELETDLIKRVSLDLQKPYTPKSIINPKHLINILQMYN